jgi:hypothetical protein
VGKVWLKKSPTKTIFSKAVGPGEPVAAERTRCQRNATIRFAIDTATSATARSSGEAWLIRFAVHPISNRAANNHISAAVTNSRMHVIKILWMVFTRFCPERQSMLLSLQLVNASGRQD